MGDQLPIPGVGPAPKAETIRALTLWRPWSECIVHGPKRIENRVWAPPASIIGKWIAIHAGKHWDAAGAAKLFEEFGRKYEDHKCPHSAIVGVAEVTGVVRESKDPFFFGPFGWTLGTVIAIEPVPCKGAMGLWSVPAHEFGLVMERARRVVR